MTATLAIRAILLMALMPDADYGAVMTALLGELVLVPWHRPFQIPVPKVLGTWRASLDPRRWPRCRPGCWPRSVPSTAIMTTGPCSSESPAMAAAGLDRRIRPRVPDSPANRAARLDRHR